MARAPRGDDLSRRLFAELVRLGQAGAPELAQRLAISQPTFSRLVAARAEGLLITGSARARRYAARRSIAELGDRVPIFEIDPRARSRRLAWLHFVEPTSFYVEALTEDLASRLHTDLPYFLNELRPSGFLGRVVPRQHPELLAPTDVRLWSADQVLRYVARFGWSLTGNLVVGERAFERYLAHAVEPPDLVATEQRKRRYAELAADALAIPIGSSAGGEQPKFLVTRARDRVALIVKFSPPTKSAPGRRQADLLVVEHLAHRVLREHGQAAAESALFEAEGRLFLEIERFDRTPLGGRRGLLSLLALDAEFVGHLRSWTDSVSALIERKLLSPSLLDPVRFLELFGRLIGNTDMHAGNLSFFAQGSRVLGLAPAYDMLPALYVGAEDHLAHRELALGAPTTADAPVWDRASRAAADLWHTVAKDPRISAGFQRIARANAAKVHAWRKAGALLPR